MYPLHDTPRRLAALSLKAPQGPSPGRSAPGFTLVEILLAITVLGLVSGIIFGSYTKTLDNVSHTDRSIHGYAQAKTCLERMTADLESIRVTPLTEYKQPETAFSDHDPWRVEGVDREGGTDFPKLTFSSLAHVDLDGDGRYGTATITYYVTKDAEGRPGYVLRRKDSFMAELFGEAGGADPILCDNVKSLAFTYIDSGGEESTSWDSDSDSSSYTTPVAVGIVLELIGPNGPEGAPIRFETTVALPCRRDKPAEAA